MNLKKHLQSIKFYSFFFIFIALFTYTVTAAAGETNIEKYATITVSSGDSLWGLSRQYKDYHKMSSTDFIEWVCSNNQLKGDTIHPGDKIHIPVLKKKIPASVVLAE